MESAPMYHFIFIVYFLNSGKCFKCLADS